MASVARTYWQAQGSNASSAEHKHMKREKEKIRQFSKQELSRSPKGTRSRAVVPLFLKRRQ